MPLAIVQTGRKVRLLSVDAGHELQAHLSALGLVPGVEIEVLRNAAPDPLLLGVKGSRIMLGRAMVRGIRVA